jgi:hypothetical protein
MEAIQLERLYQDKQKLDLFIQRLKDSKQYDRLKKVIQKKEYLDSRIAEVIST